MKLGLESYTTRNSGLDPAGVLGLAAELGLSGVLFELTPFDSFRDDYLAAVRRAAESRGSTSNSAWARSCTGTPWPKRAAGCWPRRATRRRSPTPRS